MLKFILGLALWIQISCGVLVVVSFVFAAWARSCAAKVRGAIADFTEFLGKAGTASDLERRQGRSLEAVDALETAAAKLGPLERAWWARVETALVPYGPDTKSRGWYLATSAGELLDEDTVIHQHYDSTFFASVPGLITSLGLLGTFVAILTGLAALHQNGEMVTGVPGLIEGLSGKFTTSVVALALSALYAVFEALALQGRMRTAREQLTAAVHRVLPRLTTSRVLVDLQAESLKQSRSLANISSDLVDKVAGIFATEFRDNVAPNFAAGVSSEMASRLSEELIPALNQVTATMSQVGTAVQRLEEMKQESVVGELRGLTESLQKSLSSSLAEMGAQFRDALSGSARDEFSGLTRTLQESSAMLGQMTVSFGSMQAAVSSVIEESRSSTSAQIASSAERAEHLNQLVEGLLVRLNDSASQNASHVSTVLTRAVSDLSEQVGGLSRELTQQVATASMQTQAAAAESMRVAGDWSAKSDERLSTLLDALDRKTTDFESASTSLVAAQKVLESTLVQNTNGLRAMHDAAAEVRAFSGALAGLQSKLTEAQHAQMQVATTTERTVGQLAAMSDHHTAILTHYDDTFARAQRVFDGLDQRLRDVLETILEKVQQYNVGVERNFQALVGHVNNTMPQMGNVLAGAAVELREQVDELTEVLGTGVRRMQA